MKPLILLLTPALLMLAGCANPGVVQVSPNTYMLSRADRAGIFGNTAALKADVIRDADAFAASKGKVAIPVSDHGTPVYPGHFATYEYQFRLVDPNDPAAKNAYLEPRADKVIETTQKISADVHTTNDRAGQPDLYTQLMKLDDLRKKGILTEAEFEAQKQKLLDGAK